MQENKVVIFLNDVVIGLKSVYKAVLFIFNHWLWLYFLLPIALSIGLMIGGKHLLAELQTITVAKEIKAIQFHEYFEEFSFRRANEFSENELSLLMVGLKIVLVLLILKMSKYLVLFLLSPVLTIVSAQVEKILTGNSYPFQWKQFVQDIYRSILFSFRNMVLQVFFIVIWHVLSFVYVDMKFVTPYFVFLLGAYYYGASLMDYTNERRRLTFEESVAFVNSNKGLAMVVGATFSALFFIDFVGIVFAPILGVVAATLGVHEKVNLAKNRYATKQKDWKKKQKEKENTKPVVTNESIKGLWKMNNKEKKENESKTKW
ncbi:MAG: hypothetical protein GY827_08925 [Cytophagales bacterium]|nr:hypothetical protein [Cytophagales bacterium]